jgi:hypothetical protein
LIIAYTGAEVPPGWLVCNGESDTPDLRERFVLGSFDAEPGGPGGGSPHAHDGFTDLVEMSTDSASPPGRSCSPPGAWCTQKSSNSTHSHDMTHDHAVESDDALPPYVDVVYLMNDSATSVPSESVFGRIDAWEDDGAAESLWTIREDLDDRFLRGSSSTESGAVGGSFAHDHAGLATLETATGMYYGGYGMTVTCYGASTTDLNHSHGYEHDHAFSEEVSAPPFVRALWVSPVEETAAPMDRSVALWSGTLDTVPTGWVLADGTHGGADLSDVYVLGTASPSSVGESGGAADHVHSMDGDPGGVTASSTGGNGHCTSGGGLMGFHSHGVPGHDHDMSPSSNDPPNWQLSYIMYIGESD